MFEVKGTQYGFNGNSATLKFTDEFHLFSTGMAGRGRNFITEVIIEANCSIVSKEKFKQSDTKLDELGQQLATS